MARPSLRELALAGNVHDVFVVLVEAAHAFELPHLSARWIEAFDVETGTVSVGADPANVTVAVPTVEVNPADANEAQTATNSTVQ